MFKTGVSDHEYRQRVRRYKPGYKPSSLVPLIAATVARHRTHEDWLGSPYRIWTPWALADAARVSLTYGTEFGRSDATDEDPQNIVKAYNQFDDPIRRDHDARSHLLRTAGEQLAWL